MRCLMPGVRPRIQPVSANVSSASSLDEVSQLELHLQRQLEEDIARIFDESIYSDLEVVCGKLKILTHSCILKARTHKFYHKLEAILHVNIGRNTFDEIYSFVSDAYTECDIQHQENEIIHYLNEKLNLKPAIAEKKNKQEDLDESDAYATPNCISPEDSLQKTLSSSPSTELTKEYYALVPIEGQVLDKELVEQDELSSGFKSFIHVHTDQLNDSQITHCIKPTTLSLNSSHITNINNHSIICEIAKDLKDIDSNSFLFDNDTNKINNATNQVRKYIKSTQLALKKSNSCEISGVAGEAGYSPDSLIADEASSSSDYLSAAHSASPGGPHASMLSNLPDYIYKMNNTITTVSDSGFDNNGMLESLNSHKDVTLADVSLTESTFHDLLTDDVPVANDSSQLPKHKSSNSQVSHKNSLKTSTADMSGRSKYEKQRQNEEILILESSSLSSETGSWESVFPPKMPEKNLCEKFINTERHNSIEPVMKAEAATNTTVIEVSDTDYKSESSSCFIDAASLIDDEETPKAEQIVHSVLRLSSEPVPCESKQTISPSEYSESNDNDDSLEQPDPDSIQKDISPTIFEMTIASEDSVQGDNSYEDFKAAISSNNCAQSSKVQSMANASTPCNSIISVKANNLKTLDSERCDNGTAILKPKNSTIEQLKMQNVKVSPLCETVRLHTIRQDILFEDFNRMHQSPPNQSEGSLKENSLPQDAFNHTDPSNNVTKPGLQWHVETTIVDASVYSISSEEYSPTPKTLCNASWVVDMSKRDNATTNKNNKKPGDNSLKGSSKYSSSSEGCKSRGSVDSDSSERSTHKFYIDLRTLPDTLPPDESGTSKASSEKKNIFSMFIDLGEKSSIKEMPARLSSSLNIKKNKSETKHSSAKAIKQRNSSINGDEAFEKLESLCDSTEMSISEILQNPIVNKIDKQKILVEKVETQDHHRSFTREIIAPTIQEEPDTELGDVFVKLSDLDRAPAEKNDIISIAPKAECSERMSRSIPSNNWGQSCNTSSRSIDIISSFHSENALSLNRLFPHLKNDFSRSMPGSLSGRTWSPLKVGASSSSDRDEPASEMSEMSSVQSSMCRSIVENSTTEDTCHNSSLIINCQSRLGQDLLRMFIEEIAPDVIVEVGGRRIKAHKCILSSRCQYFAGILSGGWVESAGNVISLPPFSYTVVHFVLCHIYSGISTIPDSVSIVELATIADMLCLEGLKEAIMFTLKARYCHHFHEPCQVCTAGVLECFPLTSVYGLDDLYRRCLRWITRHFRKVWPTKAFATLPSELLEKCYQEQILNLSTHNLIDTVHDCGLTVASLQRCRWADVVARLCRKLASAAAELAAAQLTEVIRTVVAAGAVRAAAHTSATRALDACLATAVDNASADELCRAHALLQDVGETPDTIALRRRCESALLRCASSALNAPAYRDLPVEVRRRLRRQVDSTAPSAPDLTSFVSYARRPAPTAPAPAPAPASSSRGNAPPRVRTTKAQEERAKYNLIKTTVAKTRDKIPAKPRDKATKGRAAYVNTKPRYLEPRPAKEPVGEAVRKPLGRLVSSSESSRNSSPVLARAPVPGPAATLRPRTADPSTDSLSDSLNANKYATYTKSRRNNTKAPPMQSSKKISNSTSNKRTKATKIPVYRGAAATTATVVTAPTTVMSSSGGERSSPLSQPRHRGSLMMATKSSSAKMVPKIQKESLQPHSKNLKEGTKAGGKTRPRSPNISDIPLMERSGTFLKDEPTFGDKTTNIDIGE